MNNGTGYIPHFSVPTKTGQGASEQIASGDDGHVQAGFYRGPTRFVVNGNLVTDLYTMLQWIADPTKIIVGDAGLIVPPTPGAATLYDQTKAYTQSSYVYVDNTQYYTARQSLPAVLTDSNPNFIWQFATMPTGHMDTGNKVYWIYNGSAISFWQDAGHTISLGSISNAVGSSYYALPSPLSGWVKTPTAMPGGSPTGTIQFINPTAIITQAGNYFNSATDSGGFWTNFGQAPASPAWSTALSNAINLTYGGVSGWSSTNPLGWRVPTINELMTLFDASVASTPFSTAPLVWTAAVISSTIVKPSSTKAFAFAVTGPTTASFPISMVAQSTGAAQRPVRSLIYNG
jgi:hypothetical protein